MNTITVALEGALSDARREAVVHCQSLVDSGVAQWKINVDGDTELHLISGEIYLFGEQGLIRLK